MTFYTDTYKMTDVYPEIIAHLEDVKKLLKQTNWVNNHSEYYIEVAIKESLCFAVFDDTKDQMIAFARVVTDYVSFYYLCDFIVDENYRKRGIAKMMLDWIINDEVKLQGLKGLLFSKDEYGLFAKFGFETNDSCMCKLYDE